MKVTLADYQQAKFERQARTRIFVYGILLRDADEAAILPDHRLTFDGFATVEAAEGECVLGGVIETERLDYYDHIEGVDPECPSSTTGFYRRVPVRLADGSYAWVYKMNRDEHAEPRQPSEAMLATMEHQYARLGHDPAELAGVPT